jgi:hypothetical protein
VRETVVANDLLTRQQKKKKKGRQADEKDSLTKNEGVIALFLVFFVFSSMISLCGANVAAAAGKQLEKLFLGFFDVLMLISFCFSFFLIWF